MSAADHLREAIDVGCTRDDHDHIADHRAEVLDEAVDALLARAGELSEMAEEEMRRDLEDEAQVWHEAAEVVRKLAAAGKDTHPGESTEPAPDCRAAVAEALRLLETAPEAFQAAPSQNITAAAHVLRQAHEAGGARD